jgi:hypothetical protein
MPMLGPVVEAREQITREHRFRDPHAPAPPRTLKAQHRTKNLCANIPQNTPLGHGFLPGLAFDAKPLELFIF